MTLFIPQNIIFDEIEDARNEAENLLLEVYLKKDPSQKETHNVQKEGNKGRHSILKAYLIVLLTLGIPSLSSLTVNPTAEKPLVTKKYPVTTVTKPQRIIYFTTASTIILSTSKVFSKSIYTKQKQNVTTAPQIEKNTEIPHKETILKEVKEIPIDSSRQNQSPTMLKNSTEKRYESSKSEGTKTSPQPIESPKSSSKPKEGLSIKLETSSIDYKNLNSDLLEIAKTRNLLSTALKDANPENLKILLDFPQE